MPRFGDVYIDNEEEICVTRDIYIMGVSGFSWLRTVRARLVDPGAFFFNATLQSFESHIKGVRNLIDLAFNAPRAHPFTSNIGGKCTNP